MPSDLTIVMYHYVRELERTRYPAIKALRVSEFRYQLEYLRKRFNIVTVAEVVHAVRSGDALPPDAALLTFDDGYIEHFTNVFPILFEARIEGAFFPPARPIVNRELLDVNRVHFILAVADIRLLGQRVDEAVLMYQKEWNLADPASYRAKWAHATRLDDAETIYVKRMLQTALPEELRTLIAKRLFAEFVTADESAFCDELYATPDQFRTMQASGMYVGSHGYAHYWLNAISEAEQRTELSRGLDFLRSVGSPVEDHWVMCYPYGGWNESLLSLLREANCAIGLTTEVAKARVGENDPLLLPRFDTNDFPKRPEDLALSIAR